jgi:hypothetical protein
MTDMFAENTPEASVSGGNLVLLSIQTSDSALSNH